MDGYALFTKVDEYLDITNGDSVSIYRVTIPAVVNDPYDRVYLEVHNSTTVSESSYLEIAVYDNQLPSNGKNLFTIRTEVWSDYVEPTSVVTTATTEGIDSSKVRIWLVANLDYEKWHLTNGTTYYSPTNIVINSGNNDRFNYYDVPQSSLTGNWGFARVNEFNYIHDNTTTPLVAYTSGNNNKLWNLSFDGSNFGFTNLEYASAIDNTLFAKVLEGYMTCSSSAINGYMALGEVETYFLPKTGTEWNMTGSLSGVLIRDYEQTSDYDTGVRETVAATDAMLNTYALNRSMI